MVYLNGDATLIRCFNGVTGQSSCEGFSVSRGGTSGSGNYNINFPFSINDRFVSVSVQNSLFGGGVGVDFEFSSLNNQLKTYVFLTSVDDAHDGGFTDRPLMVIVY
jgi:hypothetical protein